ncbi:MAG TPA: PfkB family carbohydrate kinase [Thermomicrobiales bacterium]|nr:PfkB family carbohydrate kinase [Thermomicrobiales bacterium]
MGMTTLLDLLDRIGGASVLVVGDLYLDCYVFGRPISISREAPIMVLNEDRQEERPGGGAAPALALAELGSAVSIAGVVGLDAEAQRLRDLLAGARIDGAGVIVDSTRPTTTKTRVVAEGFLLFPQQIVRVDRQDRSPATAGIERALSAAIHAAQCDAILISDYRSGVVTEQVVAAVREAQAVRGVLTTVDSQGELAKFGGFDLVKCNQSEAEALLGHALGDRAARERELSALRARLDCHCLVVTRGGDGASLASANGDGDEGGYAEIPSVNRSEIFDVTGAGDTVVAVMTAALLAGGTALEAARLAQVAAGVVVRKWGNAQATRAEIAAEISKLGPDELTTA